MGRGSGGGLLLGAKPFAGCRRYPGQEGDRGPGFLCSLLGAVPQPQRDSERGAQVPGQKQLEGVTDSVAQQTLIQHCF